MLAARRVEFGGATFELALDGQCHLQVHGSDQLDEQGSDGSVGRHAGYLVLVLLADRPGVSLPPALLTWRVELEGMSMNEASASPSKKPDLPKPDLPKIDDKTPCQHVWQAALSLHVMCAKCGEIKRVLPDFLVYD
jgi:hypothetical protein